MILVDTSVWVDHLRTGDAALAARLDAGEVMTHPLVIGELAVGRLGRRRLTLESLLDLPRTAVASDDEVLLYIETHTLFGLGLSYVDACLLASTRLTSDATLWTRDRRLAEAAAGLGLAFVE